MAHDVFISYSVRDKAVADAVCATLEGRRIRCWIAPRDVLPGIPFAEALIDALNQSSILVLVFSSSSNNSPQVMREVERAVNKGIPIIPLRIEDVTPSKAMEYFLSTPHWLDALTPPLEKHLQKLADTVQVLLAATAGGGPPAPGPQVKPGERPGAGRLPRWENWRLRVALVVLAGVVAGALVMWAVTRPLGAPPPPPGVAARQTPPPVSAALPSPTPAPSPATAPTASPTVAVPVGKAATPATSTPPAARDAPTQAGTPRPQPVAAISPQNAGQVTELARFGKGSINQVAYSPDGKLFAVGSSKGVYFYDASTLSELRFIATSIGVQSVAFAPDGQAVASALYDGTVTLWGTTDGAVLRTLKGHPARGGSVAFAPDGQSLAHASEDAVLLWRIEDGALLQTWPGRGFVAFAPDGQTVASGSGQGLVRLWDVSGGTLLRTLQVDIRPSDTRFPGALAFASGGKTLASVSEDSSVRLWRVSDGTLLCRLPGYATSSGVLALAALGDTLATGSLDGTVRLWRVGDCAPLSTLQVFLPGKGSEAKVHTVAFAPDGQTLVTGSADNIVRIWRVSDGTLRGTLEDYTGRVTRVAFAAGGQMLATTSEDMTVKMWRSSDGMLVRTLWGQNSGELWSLAVSPDGQTMATGSNDKTIRLWRVSDGAMLHALEGHKGEVVSLAFAPDGQTLASAGSAEYVGGEGKPGGQLGHWPDAIRLWRVSDGALLRTLEGHNGCLKSLAFAPDGQTLAAAACEDGVLLWRVSDGRLLRTFEANRQSAIMVAFAPDGLTLASGWEYGVIRLWRPSDGTLLRALRPYPGAVTSMSFASNGETLASGALDNTVQLWRVSDGTLLRTLEGTGGGSPGYAPQGVAFSPDGKTIASWSFGGGTVRLLGVPP